RAVLRVARVEQRCCDGALDLAAILLAHDARFPPGAVDRHSAAASIEIHRFRPGEIDSPVLTQLEQAGLCEDRIRVQGAPGALGAVIRYKDNDCLRETAPEQGNVV